jgi:hypothetical protein
METLHCESCGEKVKQEGSDVHSCDCTTYEESEEGAFEYLPDEVESWDYISYDG